MVWAECGGVPIWDRSRVWCPPSREAVKALGDRSAKVMGEEGGIVEDGHWGVQSEGWDGKTCPV